ncbi:ParA family protein [Pseudomonas umsongensis]|uniref:ParA family protein n=1 Tax=Pseudomonas umsongensis TaxID=198618 RepID=UPI001243CA1C|nr:ParA family protein [Pseudomonas umsongensis]QFG29393.1 ParA family protein [Pseudomonas umsongensis]
MRVVSVISTKGGVGKTTVTANLGGLLADASLRVLLLDLDSQPTLSSYYPLEHVAPAGAYELIALNLTDPPQIVSHTRLDNLDLILSNDHRGQLNTLLLHAPDGRLRLRHLLDGFRDQYDLLLIDTQGARSVLLEMAILASDLVLSPINPEMLAARELSRGTLKLLGDLEPFRHLGIAIPPLRLLLNQVDLVRLDARMIVRGLRDSFPAASSIAVLNTVIPNRVAYVNAASLGLPVHRIETSRPSGRRSPSALQTLQALAIELFPEWQAAILRVGPSAEKP